jgi:voltage-gated potassium channel
MAERVETAVTPGDGRADPRRDSRAVDQRAAPATGVVEKAIVDEQRWEILHRLEGWLETPMVVLGFAWLALLIADLLWGLSPLLQVVTNLIWIVFGVDFVVRFMLAPQKVAFLRTHWLTAVSLVVPALRTLRIVQAIRLLRAAQAARGLQLLRLVASTNRGMQALSITMGRRGVGYVLGATAVVTVTAAAGMYAFEHDLPGGGGLDNYGSALWFTIMILTTLGSEYWPKTPEGRVLCILLSIYAISVFGYITATLASFFVDRDTDSEESGPAGEKSVAALREEVAALRAEIHTLVAQLQTNPDRAPVAPAVGPERAPALPGGSQRRAA